MKDILCIIGPMSFLFSCSDKKNQVDGVLKMEVNLAVKEVSVLDVFSKLEVIPLETTDSNLLIWPDKVLIENGIIGIFDPRHPALFMFDENGKFLRKIGKKGDGPEEYREIYDVILNSENNTIQMLSPFGEIFSYTTSGDFIERIKLPQKANYQSLENFGDYYLTWSMPMNDDKCISVISKQDNRFDCEFYTGNSSLNSLYPRRFYDYNGEKYFFEPFHRGVYKVTRDSLTLSFQWDFGSDNYDISKYGYMDNTTNRSSEGKKMIRELKDSTIPYIISKQNQTDSFYYAQLVYGFTPKGIHHLFRMKNSDNMFFFKETKEGINLYPLLFTQKFMVCLVPTNELEHYEAVLSKEELNKIEGRTEDDNPCLIKYYYK